MLVQSLKNLDQMPFYAPSPAGWPDAAAAWVSPESVLKRAEWCGNFAARIPNPPDPAQLAQDGIGELGGIGRIGNARREIAAPFGAFQDRFRRNPGGRRVGPARGRRRVEGHLIQVLEALHQHRRFRREAGDAASGNDEIVGRAIFGEGLVPDILSLDHRCMDRPQIAAGVAEHLGDALDIVMRRHVAVKLARHFIADEPPHDDVERIAKVFRDTGGDLRAVHTAVVETKDIWDKPFAKYRTPDDLVVSACRVAGFTPEAPMLVQSLKNLDQMPFYAPSPAGWPDAAAAWVSPESVLKRAEWCGNFAARIPNPPDPAQLADAVLGEAMPAETLEAIRRAPSRRDGLALLFAAPEFQKR